MQERDYQNFDYLDIIVKKISQTEIENAYSSFLWEKIYNNDDKRYKDVVNLGFRRPHTIKNKNRLQLLEVYYQCAINEKAQLKIKKHSKSKGQTTRTILFSAIFLLGVGVFIYLLKTLFSIILGSLLSLGIICGVLIKARKIRKLFINENSVYLEKSNRIDNEISKILTEVSLLTEKTAYNGGENEEV